MADLFSSLTSAASLLAGNPIGAAAGGLGVGLGLAGGITSMIGSSEANSAQQAMINTQMQENSVREAAAAVQARNQSIQNMRSAQMASAQKLAAGVAGGSGQSSGLSGARASVAGQAEFNQSNISLNMQSAQQMFSLDNQLSQEKMQYANAEQLTQMGSGMSGMGGGIIGSLNPIKSLFGTGA